MPRNPIRTTTKAAWTEDQLKAAIESVRNGEKIRTVGRKYGIHEATLRKRLKVGLTGGPNMGRKAVFNKTQESEISVHLILLAKLFYGVTLTELRRMAYEYAERNNIKHNFNKATKLAGKDWAQAFIKRNPQLSLRKPEATSINRILGFNKTELNNFYNNLRTVLDKYQFLPSRIFNVDETGISTVQKPPSIIGPKGQKQVGSATSLERGRNITLCFAMSATGVFIAPMFIFPGVRASTGIKRGGPAGSIYKMSESGWMNEHLFLEWLKHFVANTYSSKEHPTLLLMDNHSSHTSLSSYNFCKENGIVVVSFPPHTSHRLQPLDLTFFGPLKNAYNRECALFLKNNGFQRINKEDVPGLLKVAYEKVAGVSKAVSGFQKAGIYPFDDSIYEDEDLGLCLTPDAAEAAMGIMETETSDGGTSSANTENKLLSERPTENHATVSVSNECLVSISEISPVPKPSTSKGRRSTYAKHHSEILTATPRKKILEELEIRKKKKLGKKNLLSKINQYNKSAKLQLKSNDKRKKKIMKAPSSDGSSTEDERNIKDLCQDDELDDVSIDIGLTLAEKNNTNNTCLFCGEFGKDKELWYRCVLCSGWVHSDCSAAETPHNFVCDYCQAQD